MDMDDYDRLVEEGEEMSTVHSRCPECRQRLERKTPFSALYRWDVDEHTLILGPVALLIILTVAVYVVAATFSKPSAFGKQ
jgi:hypothetical protein